MLYYVDNFRSFYDTKINLAQVNFFVGENSTGKTSLMSLLDLINSPNFWLNYDFNTESILLGSFEDMLSVKSTTDKFRIGLYFQNTEKKKRQALTNSILYLLSFKDDNGLAFPSELILFIGSYLLIIKRIKKKIKHKIINTDLMIDSKKDIECNFKTIKETISAVEKTTDFEELEEDIEERTPLTFLPQFIFGQNSNLKKILRELPPFPFFSKNISWFAPIRCKPKPFYLGMKSRFSPEGEHTPYILKTILSKRGRQAKERKEFMASINKFGKESGLFNSIKVVTLGKGKTSPFELDIIKNGAAYKISSVGYGVSQIFPILIDILAKERSSWFSIQQPEIHLHPKAQAAFGELLFQLSIKDKKSFIIETHSDFIIDRFRYCLSKSDRKVSSKIFYFEKDKTSNIIKSIDIKSNGQYPDNLPDNFRTFFINESLKMLNL